MAGLFDLKKIKVSGRVTESDGVLYLGYSASFVEFRFEGISASVKLVSDMAFDDEKLRARAAVFIKERGGTWEEPAFTLMMDEKEKDISIFNSYEPREVSVRIMKYSEAAFASLGIKDIQVAGKLIVPEKEKGPRLAFIGDSITCGYGIEGVLGKDVFNTAQENPWNAYACLTARALNSEFELFSWSGNGMISHYVDESVNTPRRDEPLIPELFGFADLTLEKRQKKENFTKWDLKYLNPDYIIINIGTNDASYTRRIAERDKEFCDVYKSFVKKLSCEYPLSRILCTIGVMRDEVDNDIKEVVGELRDEGTKNVSFIKWPLQLEEDGYATDFHPSAVTHKKMAKQLTELILSFNELKKEH
ncbi:MAG: GDSL family lipase [Lachnospiraceae bacterium]|nr:GDSL family lipase [Lachnospiraceae bacterium]